MESWTDQSKDFPEQQERQYSDLRPLREKFADYCRVESAETPERKAVRRLAASVRKLQECDLSVSYKPSPMPNADTRGTLKLGSLEYYTSIDQSLIKFTTPSGLPNVFRIKNINHENVLSFEAFEEHALMILAKERAQQELRDECTVAPKANIDTRKKAPLLPK